MLSPMLNPLKHRRMLQHLRYHNEDNLPPSQIQLIDFTLFSVYIEDDCVFNVEVHHVFCFEEEASDYFAVFGFDGSHGSFAVVQEDDWDADAIVSYD